MWQSYAVKIRLQLLHTLYKYLIGYQDSRAERREEFTLKTLTSAIDSEEFARYGQSFPG